MLKLLMIGVILFGILSCKVPTLEAPIKMYDVHFGFDEAGTGMRNLNIKSKPKKVGMWVDKKKVVFVPLADVPKQLTCFSTKDWDVIIVPKLKEGARAWRDYQN